MDIKKVIRSRGYSLEMVAKELGTSQSALSQSIAGNPTVEKLKDIAGVIGCPVSEFFSDEEDYTPPFIAMVRSGDCFREVHSLEELKAIVKELSR